MDKLWKDVGRDTEAGKLLFNLYPPSSKVSYPTVKKKSKQTLAKEEEEKKRGGKKKMACPQKAEVEYPKLPAPKRRKWHMIDFVPRKKNEKVIKTELDKGKGVVKPRPGVDRKRMIDDLQDKFQFQGMKGAVVGVDPKIRKKQQLEEMMRQAPVTKSTRSGFIVPDYAAEYYAERYGKTLDPSSLKRQAPSEAGYSTVDEQYQELEDLFSDVVKEIEERQDYLKEITKLGGSKDIEERTKREIVERIAELQKIRTMQKKL
ncbi:unnamed protein product [Moneuplotes crassus]|uniref:Uncharacterized protein n=1 Tax=Euplotes crassus TaxID=5936 RepID=A0AAD1XR76_EUPCR|nr:unnamed protein product [Moneuplotes crassus]